MSKMTRDQREIQRLKRALRDVRALAINGLKPVTPNDTRDAYGKRADALRDVRQAVTAALSKKAETTAEEEYSYAEYLAKYSPKAYAEWVDEQTARRRRATRGPRAGRARAERREGR
jgi:hypothetical protein